MRSIVWIALFALVACSSPATQPHPVAPVTPAPPCNCPKVVLSPVVRPSLDGYWSGTLAGTLRIALRVNNGEGIVDSLDQGASFPAEKLRLEGNKVRFEISVVGGSYEGTLAGEKIDGAWTQAGATQPLVLARGTAPPPEKPRPPLDAPIDLTMQTTPYPLRSGGATYFAYELRVAAAGPMTLDRVEVLAGTRSLATFDRAALVEMVGKAEPGEKRLAFGPGQTAPVFVWFKVDGAVPAKLEHKVTVVSAERSFTVSGPTVAVGSAPRVFAPPLKGTRWLAGNGPGNKSHHRRALIPLGGRARIAQRFAIDWLKVGDDGATFKGDPSDNKSYHCYGQQALAIGDGTVVAVKDGIAENVPQKMPKDITLETVAGNFVVVDLGGGAYAMWAHFVPGSLKVKVGDRVKAGQVLGLVGNSGNSSEPHLHFQVMDAAAPLASEGLPHAYAAYTLLGADGAADQVRKNELPLEGELVSFP